MDDQRLQSLALSGSLQRKTLDGSCGLLPYQIREKPQTNVRNLTDTTAVGAVAGQKQLEATR